MKNSIFSINTGQKVISAALSAALLVSAGGVAHADPSPAAASSRPSGDNLSKEQKALQQTLSPEQPVGTGRTEISSGHVDMGPRFTDGKFQLMIHDDHAATPIWRSRPQIRHRWANRRARTLRLLPIVRGPHPVGSLSCRWCSALGLWWCLPHRGSS